MTRSKPITLLAGAAALPLIALTAAACGGGGATAAKPAPKPAKSAPASVHIANSGLGKILVDSQGRTLYLFKKDSGTTSACTGACATAWPPLRSNGNPTVGSGANASLVGTTARSDGSRQVTYNGHPLYLFIKDQKPGDTNGEGVTAFGASWFALSAAGNQVGEPSSSVSHSASSAPVTPAAPKPTPAASSSPAPSPTPPPAAPKPTPPPAVAPAPGIPQNNGGDGDSDNNGGPSDGDGAV